MKIVIRLFFIVIIVIILYFLIYPVPFDPVSHQLPPNPGLEGPYAKNNRLASAIPMLEDVGEGPEDIAIGPDSLLYTGYADGRIIKFTLQGELINTLTNTGGRPLGMQFDSSGNLIVADAIKGLLSVSANGVIEVLVDTVEGSRVFLADDLDIDKDGVIWFTDATQRFHLEEYLLEYYELQATGRLLSYDPGSKKTKIELDNLRFANGVALGPDDQYVLVNETVGIQINKLWIRGPKKGQHEVLPIDLPAYPDNISYNKKGIFWLALPVIRVAEFEPFCTKPFLRKVIARIPPFLLQVEPTSHYGIIIGLDTLGQVVYNFQDSTGNYGNLTSVNEYDGSLYIGSIGMHKIGKYRYE